MLDLIKKSFFAGIGALALTEEKVHEVIDEFVQKGELSQKEGETLLNDLQKVMDENKAKLTTMIDEQVKNLNDELHKELQFPIPYDVLALQDCIDLAIFLIRSTMTLQRLAVTVRGVGGPVEVAVITRSKSIDFVQKKEIMD